MQRETIRENHGPWRRFLATLGLLGVVAIQVGAEAPPAESKPVLTQIRQVTALTRPEADQQFAVRVRGVVTCYDSALGLFFVQDATAGVFVWMGTPTAGLKDGQAVAVRGVTGAGLLSPIILASAATILGPGQAPAARPVSLGQVISGSEDAQWVSVRGIVHRATEGWGGWELDLVAGGGHLTLHVLRHPKDSPASLVDSRIRARGVVGGLFDKQKQLTGFTLYVPEAKDITVIEPSPGVALQAPLRSIRTLEESSLLSLSGHRIRLRAVVTLQRPGRLLIIEDGGNPIPVSTSQATPVAPGERVEVAGFPGRKGSAWFLEDAVFRKLGDGPPPTPTRITAAQALAGGHENQLVQLDARFLTTTVAAGWRQDLLETGEQLVVATGPATPTATTPGEPQPGSRVRVTGVCRVLGDGERAPRSLEVWLRGPRDLAVLAAPSWWTGERTRWVLALGLTLLGTSGLWLAQLQRRRRPLAMALREREEALRLSEQRLRRSLEERERLGRDLHDGVIQSVYAVGLALDDCRHLLRRDPAQAETRLAKCLSDLNGLIRDLRNFIGGLEPEAIRGRELETALKSLGLTLGETHGGRFVLRVDPVAAERLAPGQATHILHIAREAMTNSLRHAQARNTIVSLQLQDDRTRLEIMDDGVGCDMNPLNATGHGLRNIAARAQELRARFDFISHPGQGTRVVLDIPWRPTG
jgi:signal transduction histidine kinase